MRRLLAQMEPVLRPSAGPPGVWRMLALTVVCGGLYGGSMGAYGLSGERAWQVAISASKVPLLLVATFAISLPSFFVLNTLLGVRSDFPAVLRALAASQAALTVVLASLAPYTLFWYASFENYHRAILFNGLMFAVATVAAQALLRRRYRPLVARNPRHRWLLALWLVTYSFVGLPGAPVQFIRSESWGNAYEVVARMIWDTLTR